MSQSKMDLSQESEQYKSPQKFGFGLLRPYKNSLIKGLLSLVIVNFADILPPIILKIAIDSIEQGGAFKVLLYCGLALIIISIVQAIFRFFWRHFFMGTSFKAAYDLRRMLFKHLLKLPYSYFNKTRTGDLMSRLTNDIQEIRFMFGIGILIVLDASFYFLTVPFIMFWLSPQLTLITIAPFIFVPIVVLTIKNAIHRHSKSVQERLSDLSSKAEENLSGIRVIKGFHTEKAEIEKFNQCGLEFVRDKLKLAAIESVFHPLLDFIIALGVLVLLYFGGNMVINEEITLGSFIAFQTYLLKLSWPMMAVGMIINLYQRSMASMERCLQILRESPAEKGTHHKPETKPEASDIEFKNLSFTYPEAKSATLKNISFKLEEGQTLGITGPVGCGKTTLLKLMMRMYNPDNGEVLIGSTNALKLKLEDLRSFFSYVPQETFLFSESIRENILFALEEKHDHLKAAQFAQMSGLEKDIADCPDELETLLGERGVNLSGGQKQRVSLARALASERPVLVLDDSTSAVDTETERMILASINSERAKRTCVIVSHRMVSLQGADIIIYLQDGEIAEMGNHHELIALKGKYAKAWERQRIRAELESGDKT